mmetsp:Transcript_1211/g.2784  ORF Transcript_1211/g.2784 Transcript_1211/m.2784 type:complete len:201 (+) Transcript_1211:47-649(+)
MARKDALLLFLLRRLLLVLLLFPTASPYRHGDHVTLLKRSQYEGLKTAWSEIGGNHSPHFGIDRTVRLDPMFDIQTRTGDQYKTDQAYKIAFSFVNDRFLSPWITVTDGKGHYLKNIFFTFRYSGHHIKGVDVDSDYHTQKIPPKHVHLVYHWEEDVDTNSELGFLTLASLALLGTVVACAIITKDFIAGTDKKSQNKYA